MSLDRPLPAAVELHIESLVVHGFPPGVEDGLQAAVEQELARLLAERGWASLAQDGVAARLDGGLFEVVPGARGEVIGAQVARAVYDVTRQPLTAPVGQEGGMQREAQLPGLRKA